VYLNFPAPQADTSCCWGLIWASGFWHRLFWMSLHNLFRESVFIQLTLYYYITITSNLYNPATRCVCLWCRKIQIHNLSLQYAKGVFIASSLWKMFCRCFFFSNIRLFTCCKCMNIGEYCSKQNIVLHEFVSAINILKDFIHETFLLMFSRIYGRKRAAFWTVNDTHKKQKRNSTWVLCTTLRSQFQYVHVLDHGHFTDIVSALAI
jgi:hypothetical protein